MTTQTLIIELPDHIVRTLTDLADKTNKSPEKLAALSIVGNLPPDIPNVREEWQADFLAMQDLTIDELRQIGSSQLPEAHQHRHLELLDKITVKTLTALERQELQKLREAADRHMLKKAYAWAVLRWRGCPTPALDELPLE